MKRVWCFEQLELNLRNVIIAFFHDIILAVREKTLTECHCLLPQQKERVLYTSCVSLDNCQLDLINTLEKPVAKLVSFQALVKRRSGVLSSCMWWSLLHKECYIIAFCRDIIYTITYVKQTIWFYNCVTILSMLLKFKGCETFCGRPL